MAFENMVNKVIENANKNITFHENDYLKDGLWHCYKCHTPKEVVIQTIGKVKTLCACEVAERDEKDRKERVSRLRDRCIPDKALHQYTFVNDDGKNQSLTTLAKLYVENFDEYNKQGKGILLYGGVGVGKTYMTVCIANALIDRGIRCFLTDFSRIGRDWEREYGHKEDYLQRLNANDVLIIDDLGVERDSQFMQEMMFSVIDYRLRAKKPLIVTTNLTAKDFTAPTDAQKERIYSRLFEACIAQHCDGEDRRRAEAKKARQEINRKIDEQLKQ